jgi:hypothetical protein
MMKQKRVERSFTFDKDKMNPAVVVVIGLLVLFALPTLFNIVFGILGAILSAVGLVIGSVFGVIGIVIGAVFGMLGIVLSLIFGFMWLWLPALIIYGLFRASTGGHHKPWKQWKHASKRMSWGCDTDKHDTYLYEDERKEKSKRKNDDVYHV